MDGRPASGHGGRPGDLGWALIWTLTATLTAWVIAAGRTRRVRTRRQRHPGSRIDQTIAASRAAWRDARRNPALWVLFIVVPVVFILTADAVTPNQPITLMLDEHGRRLAQRFAMPDVHGATMAPIAIASLAALVGLFSLLDARDGDRRAALARLRTGALLSARLTVLSLAALAATAISLATTALIFHPPAGRSTPPRTSSSR